MSSNGTRRRAKPGEVRRYYKYRDQGFTVEDAARALGFKKSWGYQRDLERRRQQKVEDEGTTSPDDFTDAVALAIAIHEGKDQDEAFDIFDRVGAGIVPLMAGLIVYLARVQADNLQGHLRALFDGEDDLLAELKADPITYRDILESVPRNIRKIRAGTLDSRHPPRVVGWEARLLDRHPDLAETKARAAEAMNGVDPDDPFGKLAELRTEIDNRKVN